MLNPDKAVLRRAGKQEFIELGLQCRRIAILGILDEEHHQERHDGRAGVDDELPGIGIAEEWAGQGPEDDDRATYDESGGVSRRFRDLVGGLAE